MMVARARVVTVEVERVLGIQILYLIHHSYLVSTDYVPGTMLCIGGSEPKQLPSLSVGTCC